VCSSSSYAWISCVQQGMRARETIAWISIVCVGIREQRVLVASVHGYCHSCAAEQTDWNIDKGVASIHHTTEELSLARSCASNQKSSCKLLCLPRVDTPRSPLSTGCNIFGRKLILNHPQHMASTDGPTFSSIVQQLQDLRGSWACSLGGATLGFGNPLVWFEFLRREWGRSSTGVRQD